MNILKLINELEEKVINLSNDFLKCLSNQNLEELEKKYNITFEIFEEISDNIEHTNEILIAKKMISLYKLNYGNFAFEVEVKTLSGLETDLTLEFELIDNKFDFRTLEVK